MNLYERLAQNNLTKYQLSKMSQIPYSTIADLFSEKTSLKKCSVDVVYKLAKSLNTTVENLLESIDDQEPERVDLEIYKSHIQHQVHDSGDLIFIEKIVTSNQIENYFESKWYPEAFYLLATVDYLSRIHEIPLYNKYDVFRKAKLKKLLFPASIAVLSSSEGTNLIKAELLKNAIPEFLQFNIVESEIRNVI